MVHLMIDDRGYDSNHINGMIDLTNKGIGVTVNLVKESEKSNSSTHAM